MTTATAPLYDRDFYAWTQEQAARLRDLGRHPSPSVAHNDPPDWEQLAEEIEDLGRSERHACEAFLELILIHLLKLEHARDQTPANHWRAEIAAFRVSYRRKATPSIARANQADLESHYRNAVEQVIPQLWPSDPTIADRLPETCHYTYVEITGGQG